MPETAPGSHRKKEKEIMENKIDWITLLLFGAIVIFGWFNIYAACYDGNHAAIFDFQTKHGKQLLWIGVSLVIALIISLTDPHIFSSTAYVIYLVILALLIITLFIGKVTKGGLSWIDFGAFKFQPSEFAKFATALALAKYMSTLDLDYRLLRTKIVSWMIILIPVGLILLQHDTGSALVFASFLLPLFREGMSGRILLFGVIAAVLFVIALLVNKYIIMAMLAAIGLLYLFVWLGKRTRSHYTWTILIFLACTLFTFSVDFVFDNVLEPHQRDRIYVLLGKTTDTKGTGYNVYQSKIAIGSGGFAGKGYLKGTITKAADIMKEAGAKTVRACASHCVMSGPASERVQNSALEEIVFTDSIPYAQRCAKVKQLSVADMFAETIRRVINNESISDQYIV